MQASQRRAVAQHRRRLADRGIARFEVRSLETDKQLIRELARKLVRNDDEAARLRAVVEKEIAQSTPVRGGIWAALRRSPLVGLELNLEREFTTGRDIDL